MDSKFKKICLFLLLILFLAICGYCSQNHCNHDDEPPKVTTLVDENIDKNKNDDTAKNIDTDKNLNIEENLGNKKPATTTKPTVSVKPNISTKPEITNKTKDQLEAMMNAEVAQSMLTISMATNPVFIDGKGEVLIVNDSSNNYPQVVEIHNLQGKLIYKSGLIGVGQKIQKATLQVNLAKGKHECIATFNAINPKNGECIGKAKAEIVLTIK